MKAIAVMPYDNVAAHDIVGDVLGISRSPVGEIRWNTCVSRGVV
jgi:hypothetical protein